MAPLPEQLWQRAPRRPVSRPRPEHPAQVSQLVMRTWTSSRSSTARRAGPSRVLRRPRVDSATCRNWARHGGVDGDVMDDTADAVGFSSQYFEG